MEEKIYGLKDLPVLNIDSGTCTDDPEAIKHHIVNILEQISRFNERVSKYIADNYVDFLPNNSSVYIHLEEGKHLEKESTALLRTLEWAQSNTDLQTTFESFQHTVWDLQITNRILAVDEIFQYLDEANTTNEYMVILDLLQKLNALVENCETAEVQAIMQTNPCYDTIRIKYLTQLHSVKKNIKEKFQRLFQFSEKQLPTLVCATIQISKDVNQLQDTVTALFHAKYDVSELCEFLMDKCLTPIVTKSASVTPSEDCAEYLKLKISYSALDAAKLEYKEVFENIKLLFSSLESVNVLVSAQHHVFGIIGEHIKGQFLKLLIDECLMDAVPATLEDYQSSTLVEDVLNFEHYLADLFFINREKDRDLGNFADHFENVYQNNFFRSLLDTGKELMKRDLQDMLLVSEKNTTEDAANIQLLFPKCMVSKSVLDFVKLLNRILRQEGETSEEISRSYNIISVLLNSYINLVPQFHKEALDLLPQPAVIFYNNCFYLHHWLAKNFGIPAAASIVKNLSAIGKKYLKKQISKQLVILKDILRADGSNLSSSDDTIIPIAMVRKCLVQLKLLESLWQHVLPQKVYNQTMGELISNCCFILNQNLMTKDTLSALEIKQATDSMNLFKCQAETLYKDHNELQHLNDWLRLDYLLKILEASLPEISEMWGSSNIRDYFKPEEVIRLIRSLYPNTERRAITLKKIF